MAESKKINAHIIETGESNYTVDIEVSGYSFKGDEPKSFGGGGLGPAPYDLLLASLGECTAMTIRWYALKKNWPLERAEVKISYQKIDNVDNFEKQIIIHGDELTDEQRERLIDVAGKCPVQRSLQ